MKEEYLPAEYRVTSTKKSIFNSLKNTSWNYRLSILLLLFAVIVNIAFIISIPVQTINSEFYFSIYEAIAGLDSLGGSIVFLEDCIPIMRYYLTYSLNFHIQYWIMLSIYSLIGSGMLLRNRSEQKLLMRSFYILLSAVILFGSIKVILMVSLVKFYVLDNILELALFLTFFPVLFIIPLHLLLRNEMLLPLEEKSTIIPKMKIYWRIPLYLIYTILTGLFYLGLQTLIS